MLVVDAGNLFSGRATVRDAERAQQVEKARLLAAGFTLVGVDGMTPGAGDLALGIDLLKELATTHNLPYVAANLDCGGEMPFPAARVVERAGLRITVVGIVGNSSKDPACHVSEPIAAAKAAIAANPGDMVVVLSNEKVQEDDALAAAIPEISLIVNGQDRQQLERPRALTNGGLLFASGSRGKQLGVTALNLTPGATRWVDVQDNMRLQDQKETYTTRIAELQKRIHDAPDEKAKERLEKQAEFLRKKIADLDAQLDALSKASGPAHRVTNALVDLGTDLADHPGTAALVKEAKVRIGAAEPVVTESAIANGPFAGSSACGGCHPAQMTQWSTTGHARAYVTLEKTNNALDRSCFACHVTGAHHPDGPKDPGAVAGLEAVGCEACHGPGKAHVGNPPTVKMRTMDVRICADCHDGKQDGGRFDYGTYLPKVTH